MLAFKLFVVLVNGLLLGLDDVENVKGSSISSSSTSLADSSLDAFVVKNGLLLGLVDVVNVKGFETSCSSSALLEVSELNAVEGLENCLLVGLKAEDVKASSTFSSSNSFADSTVAAFVVKNGFLVALDDVVKVNGFDVSSSSSKVSNVLEVSAILAVDGLENCLLVGLETTEVEASSSFSSSNSSADSTVTAFVVKNGFLVALDDVVNVNGFETSCSSFVLLEVSALLAVDGRENCLLVGLEDTNASSTISSSKSIADSTAEALVVKNGFLVALDDVEKVNGFETSCSSSKLLELSALLAVEGLLNCLLVGLTDVAAFVTKLEAIGNRDVCCSSSLFSSSI